MKLIIAEKPSGAAHIHEAVGGTKKDGYIEGGEYTITWAIGHLLEIDNSFMPKAWDIANLPIFPDQFKYATTKEKARQFKVVKELVSKASEIIIATDAGREGELIARLILRQAGWQHWNKTYRFWVSEPWQPQVVQKGLQNLKPAESYDSLYYSALTRQHADWLTGINLTQLVTLKAGDGGTWTVGRVQTPTLRLIVDRDLEIKNFKPEEYHVVKATFEKNGSRVECAYKGSLGQETGQIATNAPPDDGEPQKEDGSRLKAEKASELIKALSGKNPARVHLVKTEDKKQSPPPLHSITSLQREANRIFGLSSRETLGCAQALYEEHKVISYPRTESQHLADDNAALAEEVLRRIGKAELVPGVAKAGKRVFDTIKLTDHHAILPLAPPPHGLKANEQQIYELVLRKFLGAFMEDYQYQATLVLIELAGHLFSANGKAEMDLGWKSLYQDEKEGVSRLPLLVKDEPLQNVGIKSERKLTSPPPYMTEDVLLEKMDKLSLGTGATRDSIIERLISSTYILRDKKHLKSSPKGQELITKLRSSKVADPEFTSEWEQKLDAIYKGKKGEAGYKDFMIGIKTFVAAEITTIKGAEIKGHSQATPKMIAFAKDLAKQNKVKLTDLSFEGVKQFIDKYSPKEPTEKRQLGKCSCGQEIQENKYSYFCECGRKLGKEILGVAIPEGKALGLFNDKAEKFAGFKGKKGKFDANLKFVGNEAKFQF